MHQQTYEDREVPTGSMSFMFKKHLLTRTSPLQVEMFLFFTKKIGGSK
ncbi:hypothetical protein G3A_16135 [Bacillus sp. 17376]|nr:hypothetical protein G3A_16135 [Bacillus sp. 17376]